MLIIYLVYLFIFIQVVDRTHKLKYGTADGILAERFCIIPGVMEGWMDVTFPSDALEPGFKF